MTASDVLEGGRSGSWIGNCVKRARSIKSSSNDLAQKIAWLKCSLLGSSLGSLCRCASKASVRLHENGFSTAFSPVIPKFLAVKTASTILCSLRVLSVERYKSNEFSTWKMPPMCKPRKAGTEKPH
jgi:hypothetical protein